MHNQFINTDEYYNCRHEEIEYSPDELVDEGIYCDLCGELKLEENVISHEYEGVQYEVCNDCIEHSLKDGLELHPQDNTFKILLDIHLKSNGLIKLIYEFISCFESCIPSNIILSQDKDGGIKILCDSFGFGMFEYNALQEGAEKIGYHSISLYISNYNKGLKISILPINK